MTSLHPRIETETLLGEGDGGRVRRSVLPGGLRVLTEAMPTVRSATIGVWVNVGSVDETPAQAGATHYLEHLLFKGTTRRGALEISSAIESVGGELNAFTAKEYTCYYARVIDSDLPLAVDVVCDMVTSSLVEQADVDAERDVVLEEIAMRDDDPADAAHEIAVEHLWAGSPLGLPILGTAEHISGMSREVVHDYYRDRYRPERIIIAVAGNVEHDEVVALVLQAFAGFLDTDAAPVPARTGGPAPATHSGVAVLDRPTEQANLLWTVPGLARTDPRRYALGVLNAAVGGGMSSRLFQEIREERGLAYSVYSFAGQYAPAGMVSVYAGCQPRKVEQVLELTRSILHDVATKGITAEELERAKGQVRGELVLGLEDTSARMSRIAKAELAYNELPSVGELLQRVESVTLDEIAEVSGLWSADPVIAAVGPFPDDARFQPFCH